MKLLFFVIVLAACLTQFASDIYAPSLPRIATDFDTSIHLVQWSMAVYLLGVSITQLIYGPISDAVGRKGPLSIGLFLMLMGSLVCLYAPNVHVLIWGRFIQGCGAGAASSLWRSVFRDVYSGKELAKYGSYLIIFIMFIFPAAPALGAHLQTYFGWRSNFIFMSGYSLIALAAIIFGFQETSKHHHLERLKISFIKQTYLILLSSPVFMGITLCTLLTYGAFFAWFVTGPVLLIKIAGISPIAFGWITFIGGGGAYALAGFINGRVVTKFGIARMLRLGWAVMFLSGLWMLCNYFIFGVGTWAIAAPVVLFYFGTTFIWPNAVALAFTPFGKIAGYAGALYGFMQLIGGVISGAIFSYLPDLTQIPLALAMLLSPLFAWLVYERCVHTKQT